SSTVVQEMRMKVSFDPSGDHAGVSGSPAELGPTTSLAPLPSAFITQIDRYRLNAIREPSGDQAGSKLSCVKSVELVSFVSPEPSAFITQMSALPMTLCTNAIFPFLPGNAAWAGAASKSSANAIVAG